MVDRFIDRVAELAGRTARVLDEIARECDEVGLSAQAAVLRRVADEHRKIALDCLVETQPIEVRRIPLGTHLRNLAEEVRQVSAELMERGVPVHQGTSEAAEQLYESANLTDQLLKRRR